MQNRYVGDIGDFAKYSLLNTLSNGRNLGVAWYLYPDEGHNLDGKHVSYLDDHEGWRDKDPFVFDRLRALVLANERNVEKLAASGACRAKAFAAELLDFPSNSPTARGYWRREWFSRVEAHLQDCDVVFCDPDNGLRRDEDYKPFNKKMWKSVPISEIERLSAGRTCVVYHHNSRFKGGHEAEIAYWLKEVRASFAIRARAFSGRTFFVVNPFGGMLEAATDWCQKFGPKYQVVSPRL